MLPELGYLSLNIGVLLTIVVLIIFWRSNNKDESLKRKVSIINSLAAIFLWWAFIILAILFIQEDYSVIAVYLNSDNSMTFMQHLMAVWASRQGVMILWAVIMVTISLLTYRSVESELGNPIVDRFVTITFLFSALIAIFTMSVRNPRPFETQQFFPNGQGLTPSLLSFWQQLHPPVAFLAYSSFIVPFAYGLSMLSYNKSEHKGPIILHKLNDFYMLLGWGMTTLFIIAGSIWGYEENWTGFWNWDPVEVAALIMWTLSTLYFHVKSQVSDNHVLRYTSAALGWIGVAFASFTVRSGLLQGLHSYVGSQVIQMIVFGSLLLGSLMGLLYAIRKSGDNLFPDYLYSLSKHRNKPKFLTFWVLVGLAMVNIIGILVQMYNSVVNDFQEYPYEYYIYLDGLLLFLLGILLVYCEIDYTRVSQNTVHYIWAGLTILFGIIVSFLLVDSFLSLVMVSMLTAALAILVVNFFLDIRDKNYKKVRVQLTHILVVMMIISYTGVDYNTEYNTVTVLEGEEVNLSNFGLTIVAERRLEGVLYYIDIEVFQNDRMIGEVHLTHGTYKGAAWTRGDWIITPFYDLFFNSLETRVDIISSDNPISIAVKKVPLANYFRVLFIMFTIVVPVGLISMYRKF